MSIPTSLPTLFTLTALTVHGVHAQESNVWWSRFSLKGLIENMLSSYSTLLFSTLISILFLVFVYKVVQFMYFASQGKTNPELLKKNLLHPILILFVVLSVWGFVLLLQSLIS